jgi:hypothetical protein
MGRSCSLRLRDLIERGDSVNQTNKAGETPLLLAAEVRAPVPRRRRTAAARRPPPLTHPLAT